jgi:hypothetical protein
MSNANNINCNSSIRIYDSNVSKPTNSILTKTLIEEYIDTLNEFERKGLSIAKDHLGPSFDMKRSSGFIRWKDSKNKK